jgi:hypothetical protein
MRAWQLALIAALLIVVAAALIFWRAGRDEPLPAAGVTQIAQIEDLRVTLWLDQDALGPRVAELRVADAAGRPADLRAVRLRFTMAEMDMAATEADTQPLGNGRYQARGTFFSMAGRWDVGEKRHTLKKSTMLPQARWNKCVNSTVFHL